MYKKLILVVGVMLCSLHAKAVLVCDPMPTLTVSLAGTYSIQRDAPIGTIITPWSPQSQATTPCGGDAGVLNSVVAQSIVAPVVSSMTLDGSSYSIYPTGAPGVGYIWKSGELLSSFIGTAYPVSGTSVQYSRTWKVSSDFTNYTVGRSAYIALVKYATIQSGPVPSLQIGQDGAMVAYNSQIQTGLGSIFFASNVIVNVLACSIGNANIQVPLEDVMADTFTAAGTTAKPKDFNLELNCDAGARVNAMLTGAQNTDTSAAGVLQLTGAGSAGVASGVGIQILYNNAPLALNNNMVLKTSAGGQETFPFTAQYYQTKDSVTAGSANAIATLNLTYQ
ncbi:fimbrial protein [Serratia fonticola]|uniref:fimbrial protein n=1 Tax=Serratia fonticola TaxID=47917 RepID=UPI00192CF8EF|nr:fimbrial protein [Serratia fonticola]MBL5826384.1 fimbrial protein [Serratia fonticola]